MVVFIFSDGYSVESSPVSSSAPFTGNQPIRDQDGAESYYSEHPDSHYSEPHGVNLERRYSDRLAGFRDDPYGGHWSSPTQSEMDQNRYDRSVESTV